MIRLALFLLPALLWAVAFGRDAFDAWVETTPFPSLAIETSEEIRDRHGQLLRAFTVADGRWRLAASLDGVDRIYFDLLLAYEDKRFQSHNGVDLLAIARAGGQALWHGKIVSGGSTLTMQTARLLEDGPTGTWQGKIRQARLALALERRLSKNEILAIYLNLAPMGGNLEGVRAASYAYFGKEPARLSPAEAALLVALPQSPETRRPDRFAGTAADARNRVLARGISVGVLSDEQHDTAVTETVSSTRVAFPAIAPHFTDRHRSGSGVSYLTLDHGLQSKLEILAERAVSDAGQKLSVALLVADHQGGEVLASVGSAGYRADERQGFVDMTRAIRSPGSTLKPLVYGLAFDQGLAHPETLIEDRPRHFGTYAPQNFDGEFRGIIRVRDALIMSLNLPVVALTEALGPARLLAHLRRAGTEIHLPSGKPGLAVALGGIGVSLEGLVRLYAGLANGGQSVEFLAKADAKIGDSQRILSPEAAWMVSDILSEIPPPRGASRSGIAYKTGTSYGHRDAWAVGYDGRHVIGIWMGRPDGSAVPGAFGGDLAAPILFQAFALLKPQIDRLPPPPPATLLVNHSRLPLPLRRFESRGAALKDARDAPKLTFPPDGANVERIEGGVFARVQDGIPPFTWLADGAPVIVNSHDRTTILPFDGKGFVSLSVIDANGRSSRAKIQLAD